MSKIKITFPNGDIFEIAPEVIAKMRTEYYSKVDGFEKGSKEWEEEFKLSMQEYELKDWLQNNLDWKDISNYATKVNSIKLTNYTDMWFDTKIEF